MKRGTIAATAAAALALVGTPALVGTASAAPNEKASSVATTKASKVEQSKWGSYVVVMKGDPLVTSFDVGDLESAAATKKAKAMTDAHAAVVGRAGVNSSKKLNDYTAVLDGFSVLASTAEAEKMAKDPAVLAVMPDQLRQAQTAPDGYGDISETEGASLTEFLGLDGADAKGDGELLGVIDTGIWPEHPSFAEDGKYHPVQLNSKLGVDKCNFGNTKANPDDAKWSCNKKLVGARQMLNTYRSVIGVLPGEYDSARDDEGHGTHTASTAAGDADVPAWIYDQDKTLDYTSGIAPRAQIVAYKALGSLGGFTSDLAAAIDMAVYDGVDVINYSIGGGPGLLSADAISFLYANDAGVHVATSAGNSGPEASTIGGPADLPWVTTVGASTQPRFYSGKVVLGDGTEIIGSSVTLGSDEMPVVDAATISNPLCLSESELNDAGAWADFEAGAQGSMVLCWRGQIGRSAKSYHVMQAGGEAMILSNQTDVDNYFTDNFRLPTVMVDNSEGDVIAAYASTEGATAQIVDTQSIATYEPAPSMAQFSSRGPNPSAESIIKPDITAPGVQVLAGASPTPIGEDYEPGQLFQAIAGTSMSSPVMAGVFLLMDQMHPTWSPAEVKSAVMTTAYQDVRDNDRTSPADPFDFGAGHVDPMEALSPGLVYDAGWYDFLGFYCGSDVRNDVFANPDATCGYLASIGVPTTVENLNYPTIGVGSLAGVATVKRTVTNVSGSTATFTASTEDPSGMSIEVSPSSFTLAPGETQDLEITITNNSAPANTAWQFGAVVFTGAGATVRSNVAVYPTAFSAPALVTGSGSAGTADITVTPGYTGTYTSVPGGLAGNVLLEGDVVQDPDQNFGGCADPGPGVTPVDIPVAADTAYLRLQFNLATDDDIDLFLCDSSNHQVASSTAGGTNELIELANPAADTYTLYVHGWQVVSPPLHFAISSWRVVSGEGGMTATPASTAVTLGEDFTVTAEWTAAPSGVSYGVVNHVKDGTTYGQTLVQVTN